MKKRSQYLLIAASTLGIVAMGYAGWAFGRISSPAQTPTPVAINTPAAAPAAPKDQPATPESSRDTNVIVVDQAPQPPVAGNFVFTVNGGQLILNDAHAAPQPTPTAGTLSHAAPDQVRTLIQPATANLTVNNNAQWGVNDPNAAVTFTLNNAAGTTTVTAGTLIINGQSVIVSKFADAHAVTLTKTGTGTLTLTPQADLSPSKAAPAQPQNPAANLP